MAVLDLIKRSELVAPLTRAEFDGNLTALETAVNSKVDTTDARLTNARIPISHNHAMTDIPDLAAALAAKANNSTVNPLVDRVENLEDSIDGIERSPGTLWSTGRPSDSLGIDGDFCYDITPGTLVLYGPKGVSPATPGHWPVAGRVLLNPGDGTTEFIADQATLESRANAGSLSPTVNYRITGTDETATVLATSIPNVVQVSSPTKPTRIVATILEGRVLSSSTPTWNVIFNTVLV